MLDSLKTERLHLRPVRVEDAPAFRRLADNPKITRMTGSFPSPFPLRSVEGLLTIFAARMAIGRAAKWSIFHDGKFVGAVGLTKIENGWDIGYWIGEPYWGQGFATEAVRAVLGHVRSCDPEATIKACVFTDNPASARMLERYGFRRSPQLCSGFSMSRGRKAPIWNFTLPPAAKAVDAAMATLACCAETA